MGSQKHSALTRFRQGGHAWWETAISDIGPGRIVLRGHRIEDLIGNISYAGMVGMLVGNLSLSAVQTRLLEAALVAGVDHGVRAPSIAAARMAATCGIPLNSAIATGINLLGDHHGGAGEQCMKLLYEVAAQGEIESAAHSAVAERLAGGGNLPGFGHQLHKHGDPRRAPLLRLVKAAEAEGEVSGRFRRAALTLEGALSAAKGQELTMNIDGATAVIYCELGFPALAGKGLFCLSRGMGIVAHALEEMQSGSLIKGPCPPGDDLERYIGPPP
ncbi:MAG: citryl-CoA lyase [Candidatus Dormibacteraceae bacterium]